MNKQRRKEIYQVIKMLEYIMQNISEDNKLEYIEQLSGIIDDIQCILDDEAMYMDNMPENLQNGYRYEVAEQACDSLDSAIDALNYISEEDDMDYISNNIIEAIKYLNEAV